MNLSSLYDINDTFWELDEKEQNEILSNILDYANKKVNRLLKQRLQNFST